MPSALLLSVGSTQSLPQPILTNPDSAFTIGVQSGRRRAFLFDFYLLPSGGKKTQTWISVWVIKLSPRHFDHV